MLRPRNPKIFPGYFVAILVGVLSWFALPGQTASRPEVMSPIAAGTRSAHPAKAQVSKAYGRLPLSFEANHGQTNSQARFVSRGSGYNLFLTPTEAVLTLTTQRAGDAQTRKDRKTETTRPFSPSLASPQSEIQNSKSTVLRLTLLGANPAPQMAGLNELPGKTNYFTGNDPSKWRTNIPTYAKVEYRAVYPGVDLVYYGNQHQLEYDFVVAPGADPDRIKLAFAGAQDVRIDVSGELVLRVTGGEIRQHRPVVYQELAGVRQEIAGRYVMKGKRQVGFELGRYDASLPLVIDPVLVYSTYLGGAADDYGFGIAVDSAGNSYVTGGVSSPNFPTTPGAFDTTFNGTFDAFVTKLNAAGTALVYSTYLGGSNFDVGRRIAVDPSGDPYVTGDTWSANFPSTPGAFDTTYNGGGEDVFVTKLDSAGSALVYSTFLGGPVNEQGNDITVDSAGSAYLTGYTGSNNFPTTPGAFDISFNGTQDVFVTQLNPAGSALVYSTFLGGSVNDFGFGIDVDAAGNAHVTGTTASSNFPTTAGAFDTSHNGGHDVFVTKLDSTGSALVYSTFVGGAGFEDYGLSIAIDSAGDAYVTGFTNSPNFPTTPGSFDSVFNGSYDCFVTKLDIAGATLVYSTFLGGAINDFGADIVVDAEGSAYLVGATSSPDFPTTPGAFDITFNGGEDAFVTKLDGAGTALDYSTYLGGILNDVGRGIAIDPVGSAYVTGFSNSPDFPTTPDAFQPAAAGSNDAFVVKIGDVSDADDDGVPDGSDNCPSTPNPDQDDDDADGVGNVCDNCPLSSNSVQEDADGDNVGDACDNCDNDPGKTEPGACGCGVAETDTDGDGTPDCNDQCPADPAKAQTGACGCGVPDTDADADGIADCNDTCPNDATNDADGDGVCGGVDNCPTTANTNQADADGDGRGDACDACPADPANDADGDGVCGNVDNCPGFTNPGQADNEGDGIGDACDADDDNDGVLDALDNCPLNANPGQEDFDLDGTGDVCDAQTGPPLNKDQCKDGGWMRFDVPRRFKNQGDCIQYFNTGK